MILAATIAQIGCVSAEGSPQGLIVHEWGTFTAVAGPDGKAVSWHPLDTSRAGADLPSFVYGPARYQEGLRGDIQTKGQSAPVRMETPVLYFYTPVEQTVSVSVRFVEGSITEWYPRVRSYDGAGVDWGQVRLVPSRDDSLLPQDGSKSHYYPARNVESALVSVCDPRNTEHERFLFYRGLGQFSLSVAARASDDGISLWTTGRAPGTVLLFERSGDKVGYSKVAPKGMAERPALDDTLDAVYREITDELVAAGLYRPEALAMLETWKGDWFEDGLRAMYIVPREETDARLPLTVSPAPKEIVRVLVGRLELPTPEQRASLTALLDSKSPDDVVLGSVSEQFGRFAEPQLMISGHPRAEKLLALRTRGGDPLALTAD